MLLALLSVLANTLYNMAPMGIVDITIGGKGEGNDDEKKPAGKKFIGVKFDCANNAYMRFYKNEEGTAYTGRCPKCLKAVKIGIAAHGTNDRFFMYDCGRV